MNDTNNKKFDLVEFTVIPGDLKRIFYNFRFAMVIILRRHYCISVFITQHKYVHDARLAENDSWEPRVHSKTSLSIVMT